MPFDVAALLMLKFYISVISWFLHSNSIAVVYRDKIMKIVTVWILIHLTVCGSVCHDGKICVPVDFKKMPAGSCGVERSVPCQVCSKQTLWSWKSWKSSLTSSFHSWEAKHSHKTLPLMFIHYLMLKIRRERACRWIVLCAYKHTLHFH